MGLGLKTFALLLWTVALSVVGIGLFTKGFLLNRLEIPIKSSCVDAPIEGGGANEGGETQNKGCWTNRHFKKAIIIIIDALRYDFTTYNTSLAPEDALPFQNKLPLIHELLTAQPAHSALFKSLADPPTTTMQRLKGLTTGSLPTFIDVSSNFASSEVTEDNFLQQLAQNNRKVVFMGDDTWTRLYPKHFHKVYPFPSFNVKDLHTVDNGVIKHLVPEMETEEGEWDVLIGHFLGVDHVGHRFGPYHPTMAEKLTQMDAILRSVVPKLTEDTVLFVMGDHGMTRTGDHGGDSVDEIGAALFMYSPAKLLQGALPQQQGGWTVSQIDFVPTLSLLLGLPIPFSNLGMVIPELFTTFSTENHTNSSAVYTNWAQNITGVEALRINAHQIRKYLDTYENLGEDLPKDVVEKLQKQLVEVDNMYDTAMKQDTLVEDAVAALIGAKEGYIKYISDVKEMCRKVWAKFDMVAMVCGFSVLCIACAASVCVTMQSQDRKLAHNLDNQLSGIAVGVGLGFVLGIISEICTNGTLTLSSMAPLILPCLGSFIGYMTTVWSKKSSQGINTVQELWRTLKSQPVDWLVATFLLGSNACSLGTNSFLINEDTSTAFLLQSLVWILLFAANFNKQSAPNKEQAQKRARAEKSFDIGRYITRPSLLLLFVVVVFSICVRLSTFFRTCREEQWWCEVPHFLKSLSTVEGGHKNARYFFAAACMALIPVSLRLFMSKNGNMDSVTPTVLSVKYALPIAAVCTSLYWAMQALPQRVLDNLPAWEQVILPRVVYVIIFSSFVSIVWKPLCLLLQIDRNYYGPDRTFQNGGKDRHLSKLYNQVRSNMRGGLSQRNGSGDMGNEVPPDTKRIPAVYGLATVYSAASLVMTVTCGQLLALLLGDGLAPAVLLLLVQMGMYLEFYAAVKRTQVRKEGLTQEGSTTVLSQVPWPVVVGWGLMTNQYFFYTGHQAAIPTIRFESAFTGFHGDFDNNFVPAVLIGLNTFASQVLFTISLPLLLVWPFCRGKWMDRKLTAGSHGNQEVLDELQKGEFVLHEHPVEYRVNSLRLYNMVFIFNIIKLGGTMVTAGYLRNHLMVWGIFAPRYIFEGVSFLVVCATMLLSYLLLLRVDDTLAGWVGKLRDYCKTQ